jgi:urocanate hydratase
MPTSATPDAPPTVRAPRGTALTCKTWQAEAAMRMLMNNLDPEVAEDPSRLVVYGGRGQAARTGPASTHRREPALASKPTRRCSCSRASRSASSHHEDAPRVLIANSNLVPHWATQEHFDELAAKGLMMYGQMTAGSWIYIGTQGILQGTYETFAECANQHFGGTLAGKLVRHRAAAAAWAAPSRSPSPQRRHLPDRRRRPHAPRAPPRTTATSTRGRRPRRGDRPRPRAQARADGLSASACTATPSSCSSGCSTAASSPDVLTDQTSAHDPLEGYVPVELCIREAAALRATDPDRLPGAEPRLDGPARARDGRAAEPRRHHLRLRQQHPPARRYDHGFDDAFAFPGFVPAYIRPQFCEGRGPLPLGRALGRPGRHLRHRQGAARPLPRTTSG